MTSISSNIKSLILGSGRASFHCGQRVAESYYPRLIANPFGPIKCNKLYEKYTVMINDMTPLLHYHRKTSEIPCSINLISINSGHNAITLRRWRKGKKNDTVWFGVVLCCLTALHLITSSTCQKNPFLFTFYCWEPMCIKWNWNSRCQESYYKTAFLSTGHWLW